jgi:hypothetical protein
MKPIAKLLLRIAITITIPQLFLDFYFKGFQGSCYVVGFILGNILAFRETSAFYKGLIDEIFKALREEIHGPDKKLKLVKK